MAQIGFAVRTLRDYQVVPDEGSGVNPYVSTDPDATPGTYTIYVTPLGDQVRGPEPRPNPVNYSNPEPPSLTLVHEGYPSLSLNLIQS